MFIGKTFTFEAAHRLPDHDGHCRRLHGHSYRVEVTLDGPVHDDGMVLDFGKLSKIWKEDLDPLLDHRTLLWIGDPLVEALHPLLGDALIRFAFVPSAENLATFIKNQLTVCLNVDDVKVARVRVYETATSWAEA